MQISNVENTKNRLDYSLRIGDKLIDLSTPIVMGIVNTTPDSFYNKSRSKSVASSLKTVEEMISEGVTIVDIGGYSSRPGADNVSISEEIERTTPLITQIRKEFPELIISLDTFRGEVAKEGIESGAQLINDISGFEIDSSMLSTIAHYKIPYVLMHMRGTPQTMKNLTDYNNIFSEMVSYFSKKIEILQNRGVNDIIIDPGFGFSKTIEQNYYLLDNMQHFQLLNKPLLAGISRKSMIYKKLGITPEESLPETIRLNKIALEKGASILRVHDVKEAVDLIK
ncbi:MAG: dihydropteroate synthase [Flavobacteriales bacterium]|nr:dihydropteroate synthase [Flavobacteriales bacterium]